MAHNSIEELCDLMPGLELQSDRVAPVHTEPPPPPRPTTLLSELQSGRVAPVHTEPPRRTTLPSPEDFFPFMKLPTEVRFMIHDIALQQTVSHAIFPPFGTPKVEPPVVMQSPYIVGVTKCPPIVGALALLHTNRELRSESADELMRLALAHVHGLRTHAFLITDTERDDYHQDFDSRFLKTSLFKSVHERLDDVVSEQWETYQDFLMAVRMYELVCLVKHGLYRLDKSGREFEHTSWKIENLLRVAAGVFPRKDWYGDVMSRPHEGHMHRVARSAHRAASESQVFLWNGPNNKLVAVERHDADWLDASKGVGQHFLWMEFHDVS